MRERKSIGKERTFQQDIRSIVELTRHLIQLTDEVWENLERLRFTARTMTIKVKYANFQQVTRSLTIEEGLDSEMMNGLLPELLSRTQAGQLAVRLVGVSVSGFNKLQLEQQMSSQLDLDLNDAF